MSGTRTPPGPPNGSAGGRGAGYGQRAAPGYLPPPRDPTPNGVRAGGWSPRAPEGFAPEGFAPGTYQPDQPGTGPAGGLPAPAGPPNHRAAGGRRFPHGLTAVLVILGVAALVLALAVTVVGPAVAGTLRDLAVSNPSMMRFGPVADIVKSGLGPTLTEPAGSDATTVKFTVPEGASAAAVARALEDQGLVKDDLAVMYLIVTGGLSDRIAAGNYSLSPSMTPEQVVARLEAPPDAVVAVALREGLRIEQIAAYLQTVGLNMDVAEFYRLASDPPASLRTDYDFLATLPQGRSLEGYLGAGTFQVYPDITPEALLRKLLDQWAETVGMGPIRAAEAQERDFYEVLALASIVDTEAAVDEERPLIAGVYANRIAKDMLLNADPTVIYAWDSMQLRDLPFEKWPDYSFWNLVGKPLATVEVPEDLAGFQTYLKRGMIPGPINSPSLASIQAALEPDTKAGYLYFVAKKDGSRTHAFAKTLKQHEANLAKYGYK